MSLVTYILLSTLIAGLRGQFQPELLGYTASKALAVVVAEIIGLKLGCYFLSISNESQLLDLVAYSGYKFVGIITTISIAEIMNGGKGTGGWIGWTVFLYTFLANSLFLVSFILVRLCGGVDLGGSILTRDSDEVTEVRAASRERRGRPGPNANGRHPVETEPKNTVSLLLFLRHTAPVCMDLEPAMILFLYESVPNRPFSIDFHYRATRRQFSCFLSCG